MDSGDWIALGALVVSGIALVVGIRANNHANRSATAAEKSAQEAARANEMQAAASAAAERRALPTLIVHPNSDREADPKTRIAQVKMPVQNEGGWCRDVVVITNWGNAPVQPPVLDNGDSGVAIARTEEWEVGYPVPIEVRFKDNLGRQRELPLSESAPGIWTTP